MREKEVVKIVLHLFSFLEIFCIPPSSYMVNIACVSHKIQTKPTKPNKIVLQNGVKQEGWGG